MIETMRLKDQQVMDMQSLAVQLRNQVNVNAEALEKAEIVIKKLSQDLEKSIQAATVL